MLTLNVPKNGQTTIYDREGREFKARQAEDGRIVMDVTETVFRALIINRTNGKHWYDANPEALASLAPR